MSTTTIEPCMASPIGKVPVEWEYTTIGQLCNVKRGASPRPISDPKWFGGSTGWVRISDVTQSNKYLRTTVDFLSEDGVSKSVRVNIGEVILTICATIGVPIIVDTDVCIHDGFVWFENLPDRVNREYWYYFLASKTDEFKTYKQTGTQGNLNTAIVGSVEFGLPPLREQKKIARILSSVDSKLALIDQQITTTQTLKKGLMQKLFTQGVGTQDADGRWQQHTEFQETELGLLPTSWDLKRLDEIASVARGRFSARPRNDPKFFGGNCPFVQTGDISASKLFLEVFSQTLNEKGISVSKVFPRHTILMTIAANIGDVALAKFSVACPDSVVGIQANTEACDPFWLFYALNTKKEALDSQATQNAQKNINLQVLNPLTLAVPPLNEQIVISQVLLSNDKKLEYLQAQKAQTQQLKKGLMQKLLTGQIRVQPDPQDH